MSLRSFIKQTQLLLEQGLHETRRAMKAQDDPLLRPVQIAQLEERILMSASPAAVAAEAPAEPPADSSSNQTLELSDQQLLDVVGDETLPAQSVNDSADSDSDSTKQSLELIFVDSSVQNVDQILADLATQDEADDSRTLEVVVLDSDRNGLAQITSSLLEHSEVDAIHVVSHGSSGEIQLGSLTLSLENIETYQSAFTAWQSSMSDQADLLFYGCNLAATNDGQQLMQLIGAACHCDVAASEDLTGHEDLGGDWDLEYEVGTVEADLAVSDNLMANWYSVLDTTTGLVGQWDFDADATDSSGNSHNGVLTGDAATINTLPATNIVGAGKLDVGGTDDHVELSPHAAALGNLTEGTIAGWIRTTNTTTTQAIFGISDFDDAFSFAAFGTYQGKLFFDVAENGYLFTVNSNAVVADGSWHHVAVTVDGSGNNLYIDGTRVTVGNLTYGHGNSASSTFFSSVADVDGVHIGGTGESGAVTYDFDGLIDEVHLYDRALTASDISDLYNARTFVVTNTNDSGVGSLRQAILDANGNSGVHDRIKFDISAGLVNGAHTINLVSALPTITDTVTIDGTTDSNWAVGSPVISLDGSGTGSTDGLVLFTGSDGSTIRGLSVHSFGDAGIKLHDSGGHTLVGNHLGTGTSGTDEWGNATFGLELLDSFNNQIGGSTAADRNVIVDNSSEGISIWGSGSTGNTVQGNYIGVDVTGNAGLGNYGDGIVIGGTASNNTIGGNRNAGEGNVISGQKGALSDGIEIDNDDTDNNKIFGNYIGTNFDGTAVIGNDRYGVVLYDGVEGTQVGGTDTGQGNIISGNNDVGVLIDGNGNAGTTLNVVAGNYIGTDVTGTVDLGNASHGVEINDGAIGNTIGGTTFAHRNVISGNQGQGIEVVGLTTSGTTIQGNLIGLDVSGMSGLRNEANGIRLNSNTGTTIGGSALGAGNIISGNDNSATSADGIYITGGGSHTVQGNVIGLGQDGLTAFGNDSSGIAIASSSNNQIGGTGATDLNVISANSYGVTITGIGSDSNIVVGNLIGTDVGGTQDRGNSGNGIDINQGASNNIIGGSAVGEGNLIAFSGNDGITIWGNGTEANVVQGNYVGTDATGSLDLGNTNIGVVISGDSDGNLIGGTDAGEGNVIAYNDSSGIEVRDANSDGNTFLGNAVYENVMGIDLGGDGVTTNDTDDADTGPNNFQNFANIVQADLSGTDLTLSGKFDTDVAGAEYRIEFFGISAADADATNGEGRDYLGAITVTTDAAGCASFSSVVLSGVVMANGDFVTATATRILLPAQVPLNDLLAYGDTSEFSDNFAINQLSSVTIDYSTYLGGVGNESISSAAVHSSGDVFIVGRTSSTDLPVTAGAFDATLDGSADLYIARISPDGNGSADLVYLTYFGGSGTEYGGAIQVDAAGNAYVSGATSSTDLPTTPGAYDTTLGGTQDSFVIKIDPTGSSLIYGTYFGGDGGSESGPDLVLDDSGRVIISGQTRSSDLPTLNAFDATLSGTSDSYIARLSADGSSLEYSTYIGGSTDNDGGGNITVDSSGLIYYANYTLSSDFQTTTGAYQTALSGTQDGVLSIIDPSLGASGLIYSTYFGGSGDEGFSDVEVDSSGYVYLYGATDSVDLATTAGAYSATLSGADDLVFVKINPLGTGAGDLTYSTYLGGTGNEYAGNMVLDGNNEVVFTGSSQAGFPTIVPLQGSHGGGTRDAVYGRIALEGTGASDLKTASYLGGASEDSGYNIDVHDNGDTFIIGITNSADFATTTGAYDTTLNGGNDNFVAKLTGLASPATNSNPTITSDGGGATAAVNIVENSTAVTTITATDVDLPAQTISYTITGGADASLFSINAAGDLSFVSAPDYEAPVDSDTDNLYEVVVEASDGAGGTDTQSISVTVTNQAITSISATGATTVSAGSTYTLNLSANENATSWVINWGDGAIDTVVGDPTSVTHTYATTQVGLTYSITASATDDSGTYIESNLLTSSDFSGELLLLDGNSGTVEQTLASTLNRPAGLAVGPDGDYYVATASGNVVRYDGTTGALVGTFVSAGSGGLSQPFDVAFGPDGHLYVASYATDEVLRYDGATGTFIDAFVIAGSGGIATPMAVDFGPDGHLYVSDWSNGTVHRYDGTTGLHIDAFADTEGFGATGFAWGPDGNLYVGRANVPQIFAFDAVTGVKVGQFTPASGPYDLSFGPDGHLYASLWSGDSIEKFNITTQTSLGLFSSNALSGIDGPWSIAFTPDQQVRITAPLNNAPTISPIGNQTITEDGTTGALAFSVSDVETPAGSLTVTASSSNTTIIPNGNLNLVNLGSGNWTIEASPALNQNGGPVTITVTVDDGTTTTDETFDVTVTAVNDDPVVASNGGGSTAEINVAENTTAVTTVASTDVDGGTPAYSITGGADAADFSIGSSSGILTFAAAPDFENPADADPDNEYVVEVTVDDGQGGSDLQTITVTVTDVADGIRVTPVSVVAIGSETLVNTSTSDTQLISANVGQGLATDSNGNYVVVWGSNNQDGDQYGIYGQRFSADGTRVGSEFQINTTTADQQLNAAVAMNAAGDFVVTWMSNLQDGDSYGVYFQRFNAAGIAQGGETLVNTTTADYQGSPAIAMANDGRFAISWVANGQDPDASLGIYGQLFDASGVAHGSEFRANTYTTGTQQLTSIGMDADGNGVITWASDGQDGDNYGVFAQRFSYSDGSVGSEFQINTTTADSQLYHDVTMLEDGRFVVAYQSRTGSDYDIFIQRYEADGSVVGSETQVNTATVVSSQAFPSVTADASGNITVVWNSTTDGAGSGVAGRRLDWSGTPIGGEFQVNTTTSGNQLYPEVVAQLDGRFVVAWSGEGVGDTDGIFTQRYGLTTNEGGGTATFEVVLDRAPSANVTIPISVSDGSEASVSTSLLTFTNLDWNIAQTVTVTGLQDYTNDGSQELQVIIGAATSSDANFGGLNPDDITVTNLEIPNTAPVNSVLVSQSISEDTGLVFSTGNGNAISISDADAGTNAINVVLTATNGTVTLSRTTGLTFNAGDGTADATVDFSGTTTDINNALEGLAFTPALNFNGAATLQIETDDQGNSGTGGSLTDDDSIAITVTAVNDAPSATIIPIAYGFNEDSVPLVLSGVSISDIDAGPNDVEVSLSVNNGDLTLGNLTGLTIVGGANGSTSLTVTGTVTDLNNALATLTYQPHSDFHGSDTFTLSVDDQGNTGGGSLTDVDTAGITVSPVNDPPMITSNGGAATASVSVVENSSSVTMVTSTDVDGGSPVYSIAGGTDAARFAIDSGSGALTFLAAPDFESPTDADTNNIYEVTVQVSDGLLSDTQAISVTVTSVDEPPVLTTNAALVVPEESTRTITTSYLSVSDTDTPDTGIVYTLTQLPGGTGSVRLNGATLGLGQTFTQDDIVNNRVTFRFSDDSSPETFRFVVSDGATSLSEATFSINGQPVNDAPVNSVPGTQLVNEETTTLISGLSVTDVDAGGSSITSRLQVTNGLLSVTLSGAASISAGANGSNDLTLSGNVTDINNTLASLTYTGNTDVVGTGADSLTITTDDGGNTGTGGALQDIGNVQIDISNVNDAPVGQPVIAGLAQEDQTLTADTSGISDADGLGAFSYQWMRDGIAISGATANAFLLSDADVGSLISVEVSYTDGHGIAEGPLTSAQTPPIANVNDAPTGSVLIDNMSPNQGDTLTASNTLADADGLSGIISYQWRRNGADIGGATSSSYTTVVADVDAVMTVVASYTDDHGTAESVSSASTAPVGNVNDPPTGSVTISGAPTEDQILTASNTLADLDGMGTVSYQWQRNGIDIAGATSTTYTLGDTDVGTLISVIASYVDGGGTAESVSSTAVGPVMNVNDAPTGSVLIDNMSPNQGDTLTASNTLADADGLSGIISYQWRRNGVDIVGATSSSYTTVVADVGAVMTVVASYTDDHGTAENVSSASTAPVGNVNDPPTGSVTISGSPTEDQILTASNTLADLDGMGTVSYQWQRNGIDIAGATSTTYTLGDTDVGTLISVIASYVDGGGTAESVSSIAVGPIANVNDSPIGIPIITGTVQEDQILAVDTSGISDADGLGAFGYQWLRDGLAITGATGTTLTLGDADVGTQISVLVSYTDGHGTPEGPLTSAPTAPVANINDEQTLVANTGLIVNEGDAGTVISQAMLETIDIDHASNQLIYTLTTAPNIATGTLNLNGTALLSGHTFTQQDINLGRLTYNHGGAELFTDSFSFIVDDGVGTATTGSFSISINPVNEAPVAIGDAFSVNQLETLSAAPGALLVNANDVDGDLLTVVLVNGPSSGMLLLNADGSFEYTPAGTFSGSDSFDYLVTDGTLNSLSVTANIDVITTIAGAASSGSSDSGTSTSSSTSTDSSTAEPASEETVESTSESETAFEEPVITSSASVRNTTAEQDSMNGFAAPNTAEQILRRTSSDQFVAVFLELVPESEGLEDDRSTRKRESRSNEESHDSANSRFLFEQVTTHMPLLGNASFDLDDGRYFQHQTQQVDEQRMEQVVVGTTAAVSTTVSVGYVVWLLRGGSLLTTVLSSLPVWASFDPLPVLESFDEADNNEDQESLASLVS